MAQDHAARIAGRIEGMRLVVAIAVIGGCLNGFAVQIAGALGGTGTQTLFLGVSPFDLVTLFVAVNFLISKPHSALAQAGPIEVMTLTLIAIPSSSVTWIAVCFYAAHIAARSQGRHRTGALLVVGLAVCSLWSSIGIRLLEREITHGEALLVSNLLLLFRPDVAWSGNLVGVLDGHRIALLPACATAQLLPKALLSIVALTLALDARRPKRIIGCLLVSALALSLMNWVRLAAMSASAENYTLIHGSVGANLFDLLQSLIVFSAAATASRSENA